jgi:hypothetical protein
MSTRCIIRGFLLSLSVALALSIWPNISYATNLGVTTNWPGLVINPGNGQTLGGGLNLTNNDMVIEATSLSTATDAYNYTWNLLATGSNNAWFSDLSGNPSIYSDSSGFSVGTSAATDSSGLTALGIVLNNDGTADDGPLLATFDGAAVDENAVLVKYTYVGDTDFDGAVTSGDLLSSTFGFKHHIAQWQFGDFDYNPAGTDSGDLLSAVFSFHHASGDPQGIGPSAEVFGGDAQPVGVPEPGTLVLGLLATIGLASFSALRRSSISRD